ncbi:MAG: hypothetical protein ACHQIG_00360 [Acidimicrobiia bacterium]
MRGIGRVLPVDRRALQLYRRNFWTIVVVAGVVFAPLSLMSAIVNQRADDWIDDPGNAPVYGTIALVASALMILGYALCAGLLDKLVVGPEFGHPRESVGSALRTLPYHRLIGLDLLTTAGVIVGLVLGIVPGLVFFTFVALAPPLLVSEHRGVVSALRRSASLVRHAFVATFVVVTLPVLLEHEIFAGLELLYDVPLAVLWALHLFASVAVLAVVVLCETTLAFTLVAEEHEAETPEAAAVA